MDGDTPVVDTATTNAETVETTATATVLPGSAVATPETPVEPSAAASKPDWTSLLLNDPEAKRRLLSDAETRRLLFEDPDIRQEIDHRASSEAGRRAKAQVERWQQEQTARLERERIEQMDPYDLGVQEKERLAQIKEDEALQERMRPIQSNIHASVLHQTSSDMFTAIRDEAKAAGMSDTDIEEKMHPMLYNSLTEFTHGTIRTIAQAMAKELAKPLAKAEAKALFEEHLAARRESTGVPESLPAAEGGQGDEEFAADYADGKSNDTARQIKWMRDNGVPV